MTYRGYEILSETKTTSTDMWSLDDDGDRDEWVKGTGDMIDVTYFVMIDGRCLYGANITNIKLMIDRAIEPEPEFVENLTAAQGISIVYQEHSVDEGALEFCQFYGGRSHCDSFDEDQCSRDGNLWGSGDAIALFCTRHAFPQEQLGYEFCSMEMGS